MEKEIPHFDGVTPDTEANEIRETEYVDGRVISADNILEHMHPREVVEFINRIYRESADAAKDALIETHGDDVKVLIRDFFKSIETWMRKHKITKFNEQYALVAVVNARMSRMVQKNIKASLDKMGEEEAK